MYQDIEAFNFSGDPTGPEKGSGWSKSLSQLPQQFPPAFLANIKHFLCAPWRWFICSSPVTCTLRINGFWESFTLWGHLKHNNIIILRSSWDNLEVGLRKWKDNKSSSYGAKKWDRQTNKQDQQLCPTLNWFSVWFYLIFLGKCSLFHLMDTVLV